MTAVMKATEEQQAKEIVLQETPRRKTRELYARFLLQRALVDDADAEIFLSTKQAVLDDFSPLELIYTGQYERAIRAVEAFTEDLTFDEELEYEFGGSVIEASAEKG